MIGRVEGPVGEDGSGGRRGSDEFHDDLLVTLLHPGDETLLPQSGSFERIRRGATRRRRIRAALGGLAVTAAAAVALPMLLAGPPAVTVVPVTPLAPRSGMSVRQSPSPSASKPPATAQPVPSTSANPTPSPTSGTPQNPRATRSDAVATPTAR